MEVVAKTDIVRRIAGWLDSNIVQCTSYIHQIVQFESCLEVGELRVNSVYVPSHCTRPMFAPFVTPAKGRKG